MHELVVRQGAFLYRHLDYPRGVPHNGENEFLPLLRVL